MDWPNYHHLLYFWTVARLGSLHRASQELMLSPPTLSIQIRQLEKQLGVKLFEKTGRSLTLTEQGRLVMRYADGIFALGTELVSTLKRQSLDLPIGLVFGISVGIPQGIISRLIPDIWTNPVAVRLKLRTSSVGDLLEELDRHQIDLVFADQPAYRSTGSRTVSHLIGECGVSLLAPPGLAKRLSARFPASLDGASMLLPAPETALHHTIQRWLESEGIRPNILAEVDDPELWCRMGPMTDSCLFVHSLIAKTLCSQHGLTILGEIRAASTKLYAIVSERKLQHPVIHSLLNQARQRWIHGFSESDFSEG